MANFTEQQLSEFSLKLGMSSEWIFGYLDDFTNFVQNKYPEIFNFFAGVSDSLDNENVDTLYELIDRSNDISNKIILNRYRMSMIIDWEITDYLEDIKMELYRITKTHKFLRSSKTNINFTSRMEIPMPLLQKQTLEDVAYSTQQDSNYNNNWIDIAFRNDLTELDYTLEDGRKIIVGFQISSRNYSIRSVIDSITGSKILGLDIQKRIEFENDDLLVLSYDETAKQAVDILINLMRGDVPEFKDFGRTRFIGTSTAAVGLSTTLREMYTVFSSDDTLTKFKVKDSTQQGSDIFMTFEVSTRLGEVINNSAALR